MNNKITWKEAGEEIFRWLAIFGAGSAAFLVGFGKGMLWPLVIVVGVLGTVWFIRGRKFAIEVAGGTLLMSGLFGIFAIFEHGSEPVGPFKLEADPWAPYMFTAFLVLGGIIIGRKFKMLR